MVWGAKWKRNISGVKTEAGRRKKVVDLIEKLAAKPNWTTNLALRFIRDRYDGKYTPHGFCDYLQSNKGAGLSDVLKAAQSYCSQ